MTDFQHAGGFGDARIDDGALDRDVLQPEGHVVAHGHMRIERIGLEHHRHTALTRRLVIDALAIDEDFAGIDALKTCNHAQQRGLAAAGWAQKHNEFVRRNGQRQLVQHGQRTELLGYVFDVDACRHCLSSHDRTGDPDQTLIRIIW